MVVEVGRGGGSSRLAIARSPNRSRESCEVRLESTRVLQLQRVRARREENRAEREEEANSAVR